MPQACQELDSSATEKSVPVFSDWAAGFICYDKSNKQKHSTFCTRIAETVLPDIRYISVSEIMLSEFPSMNNHKYEFVVGKCDEALQLDDKNWRAIWCLAQADQSQSLNDKAEQRLQNLVENLHDVDFREKNPKHWNSILDALLESYAILGKPTKAIRVLRDLSETFTDDIELVENGIDFVKRQEEKFGEYVHLNRILHAFSTPTSTDGRSPMALFLLDRAEIPELHEDIAAALQDDVGLVVKVYEDAIRAKAEEEAEVEAEAGAEVGAETEAEREAYNNTFKRSCLRFWYGLALYYQHKVREAVLVWEKIDFTRAKRNLEAIELFANAGGKLASCYIQLVKESKKIDQAGYVEKLKELKGTADQTLGSDVHYLTLLLSRIYILTKNKDMAISCARRYIITAIDLLTDDTYGNDYKGYIMLGEAFTALDDESNAKIAWSMINPGDDGHNFDVPIVCDGGCGHTWPTHPNEDIFICKDCAHVRLCEGCHNKLQSGRLKNRVCGRGHEFFRVPKWDGRVKKELKGRIDRSGGVDMMTEEWLDGIKSQYGIRKTDLQPQHGRWSNIRKLFESVQRDIHTKALRSSKGIKKAAEGDVAL